MKPPSFPFPWHWAKLNRSSSDGDSSIAAVDPNNVSSLCDCLGHLQHVCFRMSEPVPVSSMNYNSDVGRMMYSIAILLLFSMVILLLMIRSIRRSNSTIEVEALLDAMRFREELDMHQRQKRRLQKAKNKVTAWLSRTNGKMWTSSPQIVLPNATAVAARNTRQNCGAAAAATDRRNDSMQSSGSFLPEIIISNSDEVMHRRQNSYTPSLSLLYDFGEHSRKNSNFTEFSDTIDLSQFSDLSFGNELDPNYAASPQPMGSQSSLNAVAGSLGTSSI